jgi:hypothetical protein
MARKRAAFPEGIAEEEQRYAQVLRDIHDLRGETQQELGRVPIQASYPLAQVDQAIKTLGGQHTQGKLAITLP